MPFVETNGVRLSYEAVGPAQAPAVLLIQGVGVGGEGWRPQLDGLKDAHRLVAFDNRGIGASTLGTDALSIEHMAADALAVMDAAGMGSAHVVGHSMGGVIAQQLALSAPQRVKSLSFLCTFSRGAEAMRMTWDKLVLGMRSYIGSRPSRRRAFVQMVMPDAYLASVDWEPLNQRLSQLFGRDLADQPAINMKQLRAMSRYDASARLRSLAELPTQVVSGALDRIALPAYGKALAAAIPGSRYIEIPDAGHAVPIQCAEKINTLLRDHFAAAKS